MHIATCRLFRQMGFMNGGLDQMAGQRIGNGLQTIPNLVLAEQDKMVEGDIMISEYLK